MYGPTHWATAQASVASPWSSLCAHPIPPLQPSETIADAGEGDALLPAGSEDCIQIRIQQRNSRKTIADDYDKKKLVKKKFACNGTVIGHPELGELIQLRGDQPKNIGQFLPETGLAKDDQLKVHGLSVLCAHWSLSEDFLAMSRISLLSLVMSLKTSKLA